MTNDDPPKNRGFGFVTYQESTTAHFVSTLTHQIDRKKVDCKKAKKRETAVDPFISDPKFKTSKIFVGGLPRDLMREELDGYFSQFGEVVDCMIIPDKNTKESRCFGFVQFYNCQSVDNVMKQYYDIKINGKWIECKKALPRETCKVLGVSGKEGSLCKKSNGERFGNNADEKNNTGIIREMWENCSGDNKENLDLNQNVMTTRDHVESEWEDNYVDVRGINELLLDDNNNQGYCNNANQQQPDQSGFKNSNGDCEAKVGLTVKKEEGGFESSEEDDLIYGDDIQEGLGECDDQNLDYECIGDGNVNNNDTNEIKNENENDFGSEEEDHNLQDFEENNNINSNRCQSDYFEENPGDCCDGQDSNTQRKYGNFFCQFIKNSSEHKYNRLS